MFNWLTYDFIIHAFLIAIIIGIAASLLSPFLVLNSQALIADSLAHVAFLGMVVGVLFSDSSLLIAIPIVVILSVLIKFITDKKGINGDAALGIISSLSLAVGLIIISKSSGFNISIESMLVGNIFSVTIPEIIVSIVCLVLILLFVVLRYKELLLITYDKSYALFLKKRVITYSYIIAILSAILIVVGVRTIGTLLISSFVIFPCVIGSQFKKGFKFTLISGAISSVIACILGITLAHYLEIPAGSTIVLVYAIILLGLIVFNRIKRNN